MKTIKNILKILEICHELNNKKNICFIINAIFQRRRKRDKILICTSSNIAADQIALDLKQMNYYTNSLKEMKI